MDKESTEHNKFICFLEQSVQPLPLGWASCSRRTSRVNSKRSWTDLSFVRSRKLKSHTLKNKERKRNFHEHNNMSLLLPLLRPPARSCPANDVQKQILKNKFLFFLKLGAARCAVSPRIKCQQQRSKYLTRAYFIRSAVRQILFYLRKTRMATLPSPHTPKKEKQNVTDFSP